MPAQRCVHQCADVQVYSCLQSHPPFEYHDGFLSVHFASQNYFEVDLTPLQEEAVWCAQLLM